VILAESVRVDGRPTSRHVAYLGSITDSAIEFMAQRCFFWDDVAERLDKLGNRITVEDRRRIEAAVAKKVPRPTPDEYKNQARQSAQAIGWEWLTEAQRAALLDEAGEWEGEDGRLTAEAKALTGSKRRCAFCGKSENEAHTLVSGAAAFICDECVEAAAKLIAERKAPPAS
jgi:hypothetical protein